MPELSDAEKLACEKKALGFYMSSHPLARHAAELQALATHRVADLAGVPEKTEVVLGGMITGVQIKNVQKSRSGLTRMAKLTFEDLSGSTPAMLWPEEFAKMEALVKNDQIVFVRGTLDRRRDPAELVISRIIPLEQGRVELTRGVVVRLHKGVHQAEHLERLLRADPGAARQPRPLSRDHGPGAGPPRDLQGRRPLAGPLRRPADPRPGERRRRRAWSALLGHRGATARIDAGTPPTVAPIARRPTALGPSSAADLEPDDPSPTIPTTCKARSAPPYHRCAIVELSRRTGRIDDRSTIPIRGRSELPKTLDPSRIISRGTVQRNILSAAMASTHNRRCKMRLVRQPPRAVVGRAGRSNRLARRDSPEGGTARKLADSASRTVRSRTFDLIRPDKFVD